MGRMIAGVALGIVGTLLAGLVVWLGVVYSGAYNVAATDPHTDAVRWTFETTLHTSVAGRADEAELPAAFSDDAIAEGALHYAESCAHCHGAPGQDPAGWSRGMRPEPPHLTEAAAEWSPAEIHWIVRNGLKMSGMPAFGAHHAPDEIVALTAFVSRLPGLTPEDYAALTGNGQGHEEGGQDTGGAHDGGTTAPVAEPAQD